MINEAKFSVEKVKIYKPRAFVIDFHGTICSIKWEDEEILPFVIENLDGYLAENWSVINLMNLIDTLKQESFVQRFQFGRDDAPLVEELEDDETDALLVRRSICDFVKWQIKNRKETRACIDLQRLIWQKGMRENKLKTVIFDDVVGVFEKWKQKSIAIYVLSSVKREEMQNYFMKYTSVGDLTKYINDYFDDSIGKRVNAETYLEIAKRIGCKTNDLVFITDSGKEAKTAAQAGCESLIILRPKNPKIREYYLTCYQSITSFNDIELVNRN